MTDPWTGEYGKVYPLTECPACGESRIRAVRGTEDADGVGFCAACGTVVELSFTRHTSDLDLITTRDGEHPAESTIGASDITVRDVVDRYEDDWTRYEIADEFGIGVEAVIQALTHYLREAGRAYDDPKQNFAYHFLGAGTHEWRDEWDPEAAPADIRADLGDMDGINLDELDDEEGELRVRTYLSMLKHERNVQFEVAIRNEYEDPRKGCETVEIIASDQGTVPNGFYRTVEKALVGTADAFADYHEDSPET